MSVKQNEIDVYQSARFSKSCRKLSEKHLKIVEDEIDKIIDNPLIGELKKGDLACKYPGNSCRIRNFCHLFINIFPFKIADINRAHSC